MDKKELTLANVNGQSIVVIENGQKLVPVKPICEALGVAWQSQLEKIKQDEILGPTITSSVTVGGDGKDREMVCLPLKYILGWLFSINHCGVIPMFTAKSVCFKFFSNINCLILWVIEFSIKFILSFV